MMSPIIITLRFFRRRRKKGTLLSTCSECIRVNHIVAQQLTALYCATSATTIHLKDSPVRLLYYIKTRKRGEQIYTTRINKEGRKKGEENHRWKRKNNKLPFLKKNRGFQRLAAELNIYQNTRLAVSFSERNSRVQANWTGVNTPTH